MTTLRFSVATLAAAAAITFASAANAQVPTPGPSGTPVTFGSPAPIGKPLPLQPNPIATTVPTTSPDGGSTTFRGRHETFVVGDYLYQPKVYNQFSHGEQSTQTDYALRGGTEFNLGDFPFMLEGEYRDYAYMHQTGLVTDPGRATQNQVRAKTEYDTDLDVRIGGKVLDPRIYTTLSYLDKQITLGGPHLVGLGSGIEKLPDYEAPLGVYFSAYYYPNLVGQVGIGPSQAQLEVLRYRVLTYQLGFTLAPGKSPVFIDIGALGDRMTGRGDAPSNQTHLSPYAGIGFFSY